MKKSVVFYAIKAVFGEVVEIMIIFFWPYYLILDEAFRADTKKMSFHLLPLQMI